MWPDHVAELHALADKIQLAPRLLFNYDRSIPVIWKHTGLLLGLDIVDAYETVPGMRDFIACASFTYDNTVEMEELYLDFLRDRERAGQYHINPELYAHIALKCIQYICGGSHK